VPDKVTLVRHDGSLMDATPEQAGRLQLLGYKEITPEQNQARLASEARADYYSTPGQEALAGGEGLVSGLSFGITDYFGDDDVKARAQYNPGIRMATETLGAMLPAFLTGGESAGISGARAAEGAGAVSRLASAMPTSVLSDAAHALSPEASLTGAIGRGALEGAVYGGTGAADHAYLDGDPITADTILHGIGWGALVGGAVSGVGHGIAAASEAAAAEKAAELRAQEPIPKGALNTMAGAEYGALRDEVGNLAAQAKEATKAADSFHSEVVDTLKRKNTGYDAVKNFIDSENPLQDKAVTFTKEVGKLGSLYEKASKAVEVGKFEAANKAIDEYSARAGEIAKKLGVEIPDPSKALRELNSVRAVQNVLKDMPKSVEGFASLSAKKIEALTAALDSSKKLPFSNNVGAAGDEFLKALGVDSATGDTMRAAQKTARGVLKSEGKPPTPPEAPEKRIGLVRKTAAYAAGGKAWLAAKGLGMGRVGSYAAFRGVRDMVMHGTEHFVGLKAHAIAAIRDAAAAWGPGLGRTVEKAGPALGFTLFGDPDSATKDQRELAKRRVKEIYGFLPTAGDAIYKAVEPLSATQPMLAPMIHKSALQAIQALGAMAPKDPGAMSKLQSLWQPSALQAEILNKQLAVFHDPIGQAVDMLRSGKLDITKINALKQISPPLFDELRMSMMGRLSQPQILNNLSYKDQIFISVALGIPLHSNASPASIATSQQIFLDRNKAPAANPRMAQGGGLPNPKDNNYATDSDKTTAR
jgi:hypothetical protein